MMINMENTKTKGLEQAEKNLEQAKNRLSNEKKKANAARRTVENRHKYMMGGVVHKYLPECYCFEESEMNEILKVAIATPQCQKVISDIKAREGGLSKNIVESEVEKDEPEGDESR